MKIIGRYINKLYKFLFNKSPYFSIITIKNEFIIDYPY